MVLPANQAQEVGPVAAFERGLYQRRGSDILQFRQALGERRRHRQAARLQHVQHGLAPGLYPGFRARWISCAVQPGNALLPGAVRKPPPSNR